MSEVIQMIIQKTGLAQEQAQVVVDMVVTHLKGKLPASVSSHLDSFLSGGVANTAGGVAEKAESTVA